MLLFLAVSLLMSQLTMHHRNTAQNLLQYDGQIHGDPDSHGTQMDLHLSPRRFGKTTVENIEATLQHSTEKYSSQHPQRSCSDKDTGEIIWNTTLPSTQRWPAVFKIETHTLLSDLTALKPKQATSLDQRGVQCKGFLLGRGRLQPRRTAVLYHGESPCRLELF